MRYNEDSTINEVDYPRAIEECIDLGLGWRLPTYDELNKLRLIYQNTDIVDNFDLHPYGLYWSSSYDNKRQSVRCITMRGVVEWSNITMGLARVRAVRSV